MENDCLGLNFSVLNINFVAAQHDGNVLANPHEISVPVGYVLVGHSRCHVKHDDGAVGLNIITVPETAQLFLTGGVPHIESGRKEVRYNIQRSLVSTKIG